MAEKILALLAAYALGATSMFLLYPKAFALAMTHSSSMRKQMRDVLDDIEKENE